MRAARVQIKGQVQGLGFRPHVYRLALKFGLVGTVSNNPTGVHIHVQGNRVTEFIAELRASPPPLARIEHVQVTAVKPLSLSEFKIVASDDKGLRDEIPALDILPDIATCPECRADIRSKDNRRFRYPFTNCTQCGPRYSIIRALPYDRPRTTMKDFTMCEDCRREYDDPADRRFHAQPNCCPVCGPKVTLLHAGGELFDAGQPIETAVKLLLAGKIIGVKSLGGYHLACDATNDAAVAELRRRKNRPDKPLAVMCAGVEVARRFCKIDARAEALLTEPARPIVLLSKLVNAELVVSPAVAPGVGDWGVMLAYTPLHHLLFDTTVELPAPAPAAGEPNPAPETALPEKPKTAKLAVLIMTSANLSDEPLISELDELKSRLGTVIDYILDHNRPIANRCDDSIVQPAPVVRTKTRKPAPAPNGPDLFIRRSRGYAPMPIALAGKGLRLPPTLACGGELKNTFALGVGNRAYLSPHIGDLANDRGLEFFNRKLELYRKWYEIKPEVIGCDLHPDYLATRYAENLALKSHRPLVRVQHHHAHIASVMAEHGLAGPVLGIALDGTGFGPDERIWGGELLQVWPDRFERLGHLRYLPLVGGEAAILEPARIAAGYFAYLFGPESLGALPDFADYRNLLTQIQLDTNVIFTSSTGRLFDAVSALTGICRVASYDGQAPAMLEAAADPKDTGSYYSEADLQRDPSGQLIIDPKTWLGRILDDLRAGVTSGRVSRRFHNTFVAAMAAAARKMAKQSRLRDVCLSGGSFQNRLLRRSIERELTAAGLKVHTNRLVPVNDGGLSLGQLLVAGTSRK